MNFELTAAEKGMLKTLRESILDCGRCPPKRNCCRFNKEFDMTLEKGIAVEAFGKKVVAELIRQKGMHDDEKGHYVLTTTCPKLEDDVCVVHDFKSLLGLEACIQFPLYAGRIQDYTMLYGDYLVVDFRCFSVEQNWSYIESELRRMTRKGEIKMRNGILTPRIKFYAGKSCDVYPFEDFLSLKAAGKVLPQKMRGY